MASHLHACQHCDDDFPCDGVIDVDADMQGKASQHCALFDGADEKWCPVCVARHSDLPLPGPDGDARPL